MTSTDRISRADVDRAFARHLEVIRGLGIPAERAELEVSHPGDRHGTRYRPVNVPTLPGGAYLGAGAAYMAISAATWTVQALQSDTARREAVDMAVIAIRDAQEVYLAPTDYDPDEVTARAERLASALAYFEASR